MGQLSSAKPSRYGQRSPRCAKKSSILRVAPKRKSDWLKAIPGDLSFSLKSYSHSTRAIRAAVSIANNEGGRSGARAVSRHQEQSTPRRHLQSHSISQRWNDREQVSPTGAPTLSRASIGSQRRYFYATFDERASAISAASIRAEVL